MLVIDYVLTGLVLTLVIVSPLGGQSANWIANHQYAQQIRIHANTFQQMIKTCATSSLISDSAQNGVGVYRQAACRSNM